MFMVYVYLVVLLNFSCRLHGLSGQTFQMQICEPKTKIMSIISTGNIDMITSPYCSSKDISKNISPSSDIL